MDDATGPLSGQHCDRPAGAEVIFGDRFYALGVG
jgi:hypothetical protein